MVRKGELFASLDLYAKTGLEEPVGASTDRGHDADAGESLRIEALGLSLRKPHAPQGRPLGTIHDT